MNAEKHNLERIYFSGGFIRGAFCLTLLQALPPTHISSSPARAGHAATISTLSYAIRFWSKGSKRALFLRHEGYIGAIGAWLKNLTEGGMETPRRREASLPDVSLGMSGNGHGSGAMNGSAVVDGDADEDQRGRSDMVDAVEVGLVQAES